MAFVESLGSYDRAVAYSEIASLADRDPIVLVDMAGDAKVARDVHERFGDNVKYSCQVGLTHWEERGSTENLPGAKPEFFFAPSQVDKRRKDWGAAGFQEKVAESWRTFLDETQDWLRVVHGHGPDAVERVYRDAVEGRTRPADGHVLSLRP
jgi:hypothetical protein